MNDPSTNDRPRRRRRSTTRPLRVVSDLPDNLPVTDAEVRLFVAMLGGHEGLRRILEGGEVTQADVDDAVAAAGRPTDRKAFGGTS